MQTTTRTLLFQQAILFKHHGTHNKSALQNIPITFLAFRSITYPTPFSHTTLLLLMSPPHLVHLPLTPTTTPPFTTFPSPLSSSKPQQALSNYNTYVKYKIKLEYNTISFNIANHTADIEILKIYISTTFKTNVSNYKSDFMLSSFQIASALTLFKIQIGTYNININDSFQQIKLLSDGIYSNHIFKICFTYVMFEIYSFNYTIIFYNQREDINTSYHVLTVPSQFYPNPSRKCIFGINRVMSNFVTLNVSTVIYL